MDSIIEELKAAESASQARTDVSPIPKYLLTH